MRVLKPRRGVIALALITGLAGAPLPSLAQTRPAGLADLVAEVAEAVVNISATQTIEDKTADAGARPAQGHAVRRHVRAVLQESRDERPAGPAAEILVARLRLRHRSHRHRHHQQPRRRRRQRHRRHLHRRPQAEGQGDRQGPEGRRGGSESRERQAAEDRKIRRQRQDPRRRRRDGGRQSVRPRRDGDRRHPLRPQPQHRKRPLRRLPADGRRHQQGQFGRPAVQPGRRGDRHQHRDPVADRRLDRHRLRDALRHRHPRDLAVAEVRRDPPRLARRAHPAGRRHHRRVRWASARRMARWSRASIRRGRPSPRASRPAT